MKSFRMARAAAVSRSVSRTCWMSSFPRLVQPLPEYHPYTDSEVPVDHPLGENVPVVQFLVPPPGEPHPHAFRDQRRQVRLATPYELRGREGSRRVRAGITGVVLHAEVLAVAAAHPQPAEKRTK